MPTTVCRATGRGWAAFTRRSRAAGIECFAGGVNVALRGSGSTRCWLASRFLLLESLTRARSLWPASGNLREEPSAGKPLARICGGESRMAELPDHHPGGLEMKLNLELAEADLDQRRPDEATQIKIPRNPVH